MNSVGRLGRLGLDSLLLRFALRLRFTTSAFLLQRTATSFLRLWFLRVSRRRSVAFLRLLDIFLTLRTSFALSGTLFDIGRGGSFVGQMSLEISPIATDDRLIPETTGNQHGERLKQMKYFLRLT